MILRRSHDEDFAYRRWAAGGGLAAGVVGFTGMALIGTVSSLEARRLLDAVLPTVRFAASSYVAGGATVLALMLTMITFSISHELEFRTAHYARLRDIAALTTAVIVGSVMLLMFLSFPIGESDDQSWDVWVFYALLLGGAIMGGAFVAIVLMLFDAVREIIKVGEDPAMSSMVIMADESPDDDPDRHRPQLDQE